MPTVRQLLGPTREAVAVALAAVTQADFTAAERRAMAKKGVALPDGSFPIPDRAYLERALKAYGRAKNKPAARRHIVKRAKALGLTDQLPDDWQPKAKAVTQQDGHHHSREVGLNVRSRYQGGRQAFDTSYGQPGTGSGTVKSGQPGPKPREAVLQVAILQTEEAERFVLGAVQAPDVVTSGRNAGRGTVSILQYSAAVIRDAAWNFARDGNFGAIGVEHNETDTSGARDVIVDFQGQYGEVVESFRAPCDMEINGQAITQGTWMVGTHITDDDTWQRIQDGELNAYSLASTEYELEPAA